MPDAALNPLCHAAWIVNGATCWVMGQASGELRRAPLPLSEWTAESGSLPG